MAKPPAKNPTKTVKQNAPRKVVAKAKPYKSEKPGRDRFSYQDVDKARIVEEICEIISTSEKGIVQICRENESYPTANTFLTWCGRDKDFGLQYANSKQRQADYLVESLNQIADDGSNDYMTTRFGRVLNQEHVQRSRLRVDTRKWIAAHLRPHKYGDRTIIAGDPDLPLTPVAKSDLSKLTKAELVAYIALQAKAEGKEE